MEGLVKNDCQRLFAVARLARGAVPNSFASRLASVTQTLASSTIVLCSLLRLVCRLQGSVCTRGSFCHLPAVQKSHGPSASRFWRRWRQGQESSPGAQTISRRLQHRVDFYAVAASTARWRDRAAVAPPVQTRWPRRRRAARAPTVDEQRDPRRTVRSLTHTGPAKKKQGGKSPGKKTVTVVVNQGGSKKKKGQQQKQQQKGKKQQQPGAAAAAAAAAAREEEGRPRQGQGEAEDR